MSARVWTMDEILSCPEFGGDVGWFYGLVRQDWYVVPAEIYPGLGYTIGWGLNPRWWILAIKDTARTRRLKAAYRGGHSMTRRVAYVWSCGDDYCDCCQAHVVDVTGSSLLDATVVASGRFYTDGEGWRDNTVGIERDHLALLYGAEDTA